MAQFEYLEKKGRRLQNQTAEMMATAAENMSRNNSKLCAFLSQKMRLAERKKKVFGMCVGEGRKKATNFRTDEVTSGR